MKKGRSCQRAQKVPNVAKKSDFQGFDILSYVVFLPEYESANGLLTFCKNCMSGKNLVLEIWSKNL